MAEAPDDAPDDVVHCGLCGTSAPVAETLAWSMEVTERGAIKLCPACTRANVRSIEGKLDSTWW